MIEEGNEVGWLSAVANWLKAGVVLPPISRPPNRLICYQAVISGDSFHLRLRQMSANRGTEQWRNGVLRLVGIIFFFFLINHLSCYLALFKARSLPKRVSICLNLNCTNFLKAQFILFVWIWDYYIHSGKHKISINQSIKSKNSNISF